MSDPTLLPVYCNHCGKPAIRKCTRCKSVVYCNAQCQRADWKSHRNFCNQVSVGQGATADRALPARLPGFGLHDGLPVSANLGNILKSDSSESDTDDSSKKHDKKKGVVRAFADKITNLGKSGIAKRNNQRGGGYNNNNKDENEDESSDDGIPDLIRRNRNDSSSDEEDESSDDGMPDLIRRNGNDSSSDEDDSDSDGSMPTLNRREVNGAWSSSSSEADNMSIGGYGNGDSDHDADNEFSMHYVAEKPMKVDATKSIAESNDSNIPELVKRNRANSSSDNSSMEKDDGSISSSSSSSSNEEDPLGKMLTTSEGRKTASRIFWCRVCEILDIDTELDKALPQELDLDGSGFKLSNSFDECSNSLFSIEDYANKKSKGPHRTLTRLALWALLEEKFTSPIFNAMIKMTERSDIIDCLKQHSNSILDVICKENRKNDLAEILDLGVAITSHQLVNIFKLLPSNRGDQFNNKIANVIVNKCQITMQNKSEVKMISGAIHDRVGKQSKKKILDHAREGGKKQANTKKSIPRKEVFINISSRQKKSDKEKSNASTVTRQENKKTKVKDTFKSKFDKDITKALSYFYELVEESKIAQREIKVESQKDEVIEEQKERVDIDKKPSKKLSSKEVVEALMKFDSYTEDEQKQKENEVLDLEANIDLSDFDHESEWIIDITEEAHKWFRKHRKRQNNFCERVVGRLKILSTGRWTYVLCKPLKTKKTNAQLYESKIDSGSRILWEVARCFSPRRSSPGHNISEQVIRVWDIVDDHDKLSDRIDLAIERIAQSLKRGEESCIYSELVVGEDEFPTKKDGIVLPRVFTVKNSAQHEAISCEKGIKKHYPPATHDRNQYTLLKFYQLNNDAIKILLGSDGDQIDLPFTPGPKEYDIIHHKSDPKRSMLLQGRSGTGKTTCLVFRMWAQYMAYVEKPRGRQPRQLFITKNGVLRNEVEHSFGTMGLAYRKRTDEEDLHDYANDYYYEEKEEDMAAQADLTRPLFLTSSEWLDVLDKELPGKCFFTPKERNIRSQSGNLLSDVVERGMQGMFISRNGDEKIERIRHEMDFKTFRKFWPKINARRKTDIDPAMVWREIYTYIKGSVRALKLEDDDRDLPSNRFLTYDEYLSLPRKQSKLDQEQRSIVFDLYQTYEKLKKENHFYDTMDVVYNLAGRAKDFTPCKKAQNANKKLLPIDSLYIDEVQDFTMAELYLVTKLSADQNNLMLAGDTAQSITEGVAFRFTDVRQIFYELFGGKTPDLLSLDHNYRSHSGILRLAACVVELLYFFFGDSLDKLPPDLGLFDGPKPTIMMASSEELALILQGERENSRIEFGAHQVVIVRNESVKDALVKEFGIDREWIMTVQESKGLEFDDVLLYNFFTESEAGDDWRVVSNYTEKEVKEYYSHQSVQSSGVSKYEWDDLVKPGRHLDFSPELHKVLETEMKILYTAITRARVNMFIVETDFELSSPMFSYFKQRKVVVEASKTTKDGISNIPVFGKMSTPDEWCKQGEAYLRQASALEFGEQLNQRLRLAAKCFENAGRKEQHKLALAYLKFVEEMDSFPEKKEDIIKNHKKRERFYEVANDLLSTGDVGFLDKAGLCLLKSGNIEKARSASIFELCARLSYVRRDKKDSLAADSFERKNLVYAARLYEELSTDETESLAFQRKHLVNAIRNHLSEGTNKGWEKASELITSNVDFLVPASKEIKELFNPSKALEQEPLSFLHQQMKIPGKIAYLHDALSLFEK